MTQLRLTAVKMTDAKVSKVSLVERGANRIPFKIMKQETPMKPFKDFDISTILKKDRPVTVEVVGVVTMKDENFESISKQLKDAGVSIEKSEELADGSVVFKQGETDEIPDGVEVIRVNDSVAIITKGFTPHPMDMCDGDKPFTEVCKAQGFYPGVGTVLAILNDSVRGLVAKSEDPKATAAEIGTLFDEVKAYVTKMVSDLPTSAFKCEDVAPVAKADDEVKADDAEKAKEVVEGDKPADEAKEVVKAEEKKEEPKDEAKKEEAKVEDDKPKDKPVETVVAEAVAKEMTSLQNTFKAAIDGLTASVTKSISGLSEKVENTEKVAKQAAEKVQGTILRGSSDDDQESLGDRTVQKTDRGDMGREVDTAYMGRGARRQRH